MDSVFNVPVSENCIDEFFAIRLHQVLKSFSISLSTEELSQKKRETISIQVRNSNEMAYKFDWKIGSPRSDAQMGTLKSKRRKSPRIVSLSVLVELINAE